MKIEKITLGETGNNFSPIFLDYLNGKAELEKFYRSKPVINDFDCLIKSRNLPAQSRQDLYEVLSAQYSQLNKPEVLTHNLEQLKDKNTFTITTGHQLNIFTGPLYFIYKIVTVINICRQLKEQFPDYHFVPVYWMASEDHDFEEINHFNLFGKTYSWQTEQQGAVGRFSPEGINQILEELPEKIALFETAYQEYETLADATRYFVNELFGEYGLVVLDADDPGLKAAFSGIIKDDLLHHKANELIEKTAASLNKMNYKTQVYPRKINFFYLKDGLRERIIKKEEQYKVLKTDITFSEKEILKEVDEHPDRFSPNVILRPVYQETILPNLAYIGGPAEVAYWLQLKPVFDRYEISFPMLMPRNFGLIINKTNVKKFNKLGIAVKDLFMDLQSLKNKFIEDNTRNIISLEKEKEFMAAIFEGIKEKAKDVDKSLTGFIGAEAHKSLKSLDNISKRLKKAEEHNQGTAIKQLESMKEKLFPNGKLQERTENFLNFYINEPGLIQFLVDNFDPFDYQFNIIIEDE